MVVTRAYIPRFKIFQTHNPKQYSRYGSQDMGISTLGLSKYDIFAFEGK